MSKSFTPNSLPLPSGTIDYSVFVEELIDATTKLEVYKEKVHDSKLDSSWFMPTLQHKEALASSALEGTQATLDGVLSYQATSNNNDQSLNEVANYYNATELGYKLLYNSKFDNDFFKKFTVP